MKIITNISKLEEESNTFAQIDEELAELMVTDFYKDVESYKELAECYKDSFIQYRKYYKSDLYKDALNRALSQYLYYLNCLKKMAYVEKIVKG